jgi:hypothetical protein
LINHFSRFAANSEVLPSNLDVAGTGFLLSSVDILPVRVFAVVIDLTFCHSILGFFPMKPRNC